MNKLAGRKIQILSILYVLVVSAIVIEVMMDKHLTLVDCLWLLIWCLIFPSAIKIWILKSGSNKEKDSSLTKYQKKKLKHIEKKLSSFVDVVTAWTILTHYGNELLYRKLTKWIREHSRRGNTAFADHEFITHETTVGDMKEWVRKEWLRISNREEDSQ